MSFWPSVLQSTGFFRFRVWVGLELLLRTDQQRREAASTGEWRLSTDWLGCPSGSKIFRRMHTTASATEMPQTTLLVSEMVAVGIILALGLKGTTMALYLGWIAVVLICIYVSSFAWSWGPLEWLIPNEIYPLDTRSAGQAITVSTNMFLSMLCAFKWGVFLFFAGWMLVMMAFTYWFIPETKGIPIEEMDLV